MSSFGTQTVSYYEDRSNGGFAWTVSYDIRFLNSIVAVDLRVKMTGDTASNSVVNTWVSGVETYWNNKAFLADANRLYEVTVNFDFVSSGQHQTIVVHDAVGRADMTNWYTVPQGWGTAYLDEIAAHEVGHMLGNYDEYSGGATKNNFVTTGTLMSDLTVSGFQSYFWTIEYYAEQFGNMTLSTVLATSGTSAADVLNGSASMNGIYGFAGNDTISGKGGNDFVDGGTGTDTAVFAGASNEYLLTLNSDGTISVEHRSGTRADGTDILKNVELARFTDATVSLNGTGSSGNDIITGDSGANRLTGGGGNDTISGLAGDDTAVFSGAVNQYTITRSGSTITVVDGTSGRDGTDTLSSIEHLQFSDRSLDLTMVAKAAAAGTADVNSLIELYVGYFNRVPGAAGLDYWIDRLQGGESLSQISEEFYAAGVQFSSVTGYTASMSNADFIQLAFANVLGRSGSTAPDANGIAYWDNEITSGNVTKGGMIQRMLHDAHLFANDPTWGWVPQLLDNKIALGNYHAVQLGIDYNSANEEIMATMALAAAVTSTDTSAAVSLIGLSNHVFV